MSLFFEAKKMNSTKLENPITLSILHLKLDIEPLFNQEILIGKEILTVTPYAYNDLDSIHFDAKYMDIQKISLREKDSDKTEVLKYHYDSSTLSIKLKKTFHRGDTFYLNIDYVAHPKRIKSVRSKAITDSKGLYFINADEKQTDIPTQVWSQGEPENNSVWFPTIEQNQQKFTQEINITVPEKLQTISNGIMINTLKQADNKRTDFWKIELPQSPYLVFFAAGKWSVIKDSFHHLPMTYFVPKEYENSGKRIFEKTPKMIAVYEKILQVPFVWQKYDQVILHDFVSGAMENTTIVSHDEAALQDNQDLEDENIWENVIAHELFHHWFGDLVTAKNWTNLTLNESFASYGEYLWFEQEYGKFFADYYKYKETQVYYNANATEKILVRENYEKPEDVFDEVTYNKGAAILHMLRDYLGDTIFFKGLQTYLLDHKFKTAEVADLRIAFEKISGRDLDWFFNQWYFTPGHPYINVSRIYDFANKQIQIIFKQQLQLGEIPYKIPISIKKNEVDDITTYKTFLGANNNINDTFIINYKNIPEFISVDPNGVIVMVKEETKSIPEYILQLKKGSAYAEKKEALNFLTRLQNENDLALQALLEATYDSSYLIRLQALEKLNMQSKAIQLKARPYLIQNYKTENNNIVIAKLIELLSAYKIPEFYAKNKQLVESASAKISAAALQLVFEYDSLKHFKTIVKTLKKTKNKSIQKKAFKLFLAYKQQHDDIDINLYFKKMPFTTKLDLLKDVLENAVDSKNAEIIKQTFKTIQDMQNQLPPAYQYIEAFISAEFDIAKELLKKKDKIIFESLFPSNKL